MGQTQPVTFESLLAQVHQLSLRDKVWLLEAVLPEIASNVEEEIAGSLTGCYGALADLGPVAYAQDIEEERKEVLGVFPRADAA